MELEIELISKVIVKPSNPTPEHLQRYNLSFLDQISPPVYNPWVLFYPPSSNNLSVTQKSEHLKQSLAEVLSYYYPLCGRLNGNVFVECNDEGVPFVHTQVNCKLSDVIHNPIPIELNKLVPFKLDDHKDCVLGIQFNVFSCGGFAIGLCLSHKIADASSLFTFIKTWAATGRKAAEIARPEFVASTLFPPKELPFGLYNPSIGITKTNIIGKRFVFNQSSVEELKAKYANSCESVIDQRPPSRVEALSVFMWSRFMATVGRGKMHLMLYAVNLRSRMDPPLPEHSFGNYYSVAITSPSNIRGEVHSDLISQVRTSIKNLDKDYVARLRGGDEHLEMMARQSQSYSRGEFVTLNFTSLCRFPIYEADFGWAKPIWVGSPVLTFKNLIVFMDTANGDGIEALVHLEKEDMDKFQEDQELLQYVEN